MKALPLLLVIGLLCGCGEEGPAIRLYIDTPADIPTELDGFQVTISASSPDDRVCDEVTGLLEVRSRDDLPMFVLLEKGTVFTKNVAYRVVGHRALEHVTEPLVGWTEWPEQGARDVEVSLTPGCFINRIGVRCYENEHCVDGVCELIDLPAELLDPDNIEDENHCWDIE